MKDKVLVAIKATWPALTHHGIYWGVAYVATGEMLAAFGATAPGILLLAAGLALSCTCLAPLANSTA